MSDRDQLEELIRAAQAGDDCAFAELVREKQDVAVAYATSVLGDYHLAEDAAQEAFVDAHLKLGSLREPRAFHVWFRTILYKHCDRMTRRKRHWTVGLETVLEVASLQPSPLEDLESKEKAKALINAVAALSDAERSVILLYYMGDHSHSIIAKLLDVTTNVVKTRLYSARKRLRSHLTDVERNLNLARPSNDSQFTRRVMSAALPLQLYFLDSRCRKCPAGSTAGFRIAEVSGADLWLIEPRGTLSSHDWDTILGLMEELEIPGIGASGQLTDELLERVSRIKHIKYLDLRDCREVTDKGLKHLSRLPGLNHLNLSCPGLTNHGLDVLRSLRQLRTFDLTHQQWVTDAGLANLAHCENLERVNVMGTPTGDDVIRTLSGKQRLSHFYAGTNVTNAGLSLLQDFPLYMNWQGGETSMSLLDFDAYPNYLWLNLKSPISNNGIASLAKLEGLGALNLFGGAGTGPFDARGSTVTSAGLRQLSTLPNLTWLGCNATLCTDEAMRAIANMPRLRFLMCQDTVASDDGFLALSRSQSLEYIWGRRCYGLTARGFSSLASMPMLQGLSVSCMNVDKDGLSSLPNFPSLKEFMPMDVDDDGFRYVGDCEKLETLHCMYCAETSDSATKHIASLERLRIYRAWGTRITDQSLEILGRMPSIEEILLSKCDGLTECGLPAIARLPKLREVSLEFLSHISADAAAVFPASVRVNYLA